MAFDWEDILGAEGNDLQDAYDDELERTDRIEYGWRKPMDDSVSVTNWLPGDGWPVSEDSCHTQGGEDTIIPSAPHLDENPEGDPDWPDFEY